MKVSASLSTSKTIRSSGHSSSFLHVRYGEDASILTENAAYAIGNSALSAYYVGGLGPKAVSVQRSRESSSVRSCLQIARKVVKQTAKETAKNAFS